MQITRAKGLRSQSKEEWRGITTRLMRDVWESEVPETSAYAPTWSQAKAYFNHYEACLRFLPVEQSGLATEPKVLDNVLEVVGLVKLHYQQQSLVRDIKSAIAQKCGAWIRDPVDHNAVAPALGFAMSLGLFVEPNLKNDGQTLARATHDQIATIPDPAAQLDALSEDFCVKSLMRKAGFEIQLTSDLTRHLQLSTNMSTIYLFRHARALEQYHRAFGRHVSHRLHFRVC